MSSSPHYRYAVYYAPPPGSAWWDAGSDWLGRCAATQQQRNQPAVPGISPEKLAAVTEAPRRYGWHATLKAPFALAQGVTDADLRNSLRTLSARLQPTPPVELRVHRLDDFLALVPNGDTAAINQVASACVTELQALAAPLSSAELARRRQAGLTDELDAMLLAWGYPYVFAHFRFHMSLTGPLHGCSAPEIAALHAAARQHFESLPACTLDHLALFAEPAKGEDFVLLEQFPLGR